MAKKSKLGKDAFDWVKDTSQEAAAPRETTKVAEPSKRPNRVTSKGKRTIFVRHKKRGGEITSIAEATEDQGETAANPHLDVPDDEDVDEFKLSGDLFTKELIEIHTQYKVETSGQTSKLVRK